MYILCGFFDFTSLLLSTLCINLNIYINKILMQPLYIGENTKMDKYKHKTYFLLPNAFNSIRISGLISSNESLKAHIFFIC